MPSGRLLAVLLTTLTCTAFAAPPNYLTLDHSTAALIDAKSAKAVWKDALPDKLVKLYPVAKWGFVTQVEGGFDDGKVCVVTARAMLMPRQGAALVFKPAKTTTTFGSQAGATPDQCKALAKTKLRESVEAMRAALLPR